MGNFNFAQAEVYPDRTDKFNEKSDKENLFQHAEDFPDFFRIGGIFKH